jgi:hypothetical protein
MTQPLRTCPACEGFAPVALAACPHCDAALPTRRPRTLARVLATMVGGSAFAMTLMACYGAMPYRSEGPNAVGCYHDGYGGSDGDADGYCAPQDCNDTNAAVFPGAEDPDLDAIDQNCDGVDGWRDPGTVATPPPGEPVSPAVIDAGAAPVEPTPIATDPAAPPAP